MIPLDVDKRSLADTRRWHTGRFKHNAPILRAASPQPGVVDFDGLRRAFGEALARLTATWKGVTAAQIEDLAAQIRAASTVEQLAAITPAAIGGHALADVLVAVVESGAQSALEEAALQGVGLLAPALDETHAAIRQAANGTAVLLSRALGQSAASKALSVWSPSSVPEQVADLVSEHLRGLAGQTAEYELSGLASQAQNEGRFAALQGSDQSVRYYASAILEDGKACERCVEEDGTEFGSLAEARRDFPNGPYVGCLGGRRCRCTLVAVYDEAGDEDV